MTRPNFDTILDQCIEDLRTGRATLNELIARHPQQAAMLEPLLRTATLTRGLAIAANPSDAARRADFLRLVRNTPQQRPRGILTALRQSLNGLLVVAYGIRRAGVDHRIRFPPLLHGHGAMGLARTQRLWRCKGWWKPINREQAARLKLVETLKYAARSWHISLP